MNKNFHEGKNKLKDTKLEMKQNFYFLTNQMYFQFLPYMNY